MSDEELYHLYSECVKAHSEAIKRVLFNLSASNKRCSLLADELANANAEIQVLLGVIQSGADYIQTMRVENKRLLNLIQNQDSNFHLL